MRLIDADALIADLDKGLWGKDYDKALAEAIIREEPSVEIIRCQDCKYTDGEPPIADGRSWCVLHGSFMYYCSDGSRSEKPNNSNERSSE